MFHLYKKAIIGAIGVLCIAMGILFFVRNGIQNDVNGVLGDFEERFSDQQAQEIVRKVGEKMILPEGEAPVISTVVNADNLRNSQEFYKHAQNGDKLLVYMDAKIAILYSAQEDKIINVGPVLSE